MPQGRFAVSSDSQAARDGGAAAEAVPGCAAGKWGKAP